MIGIYKITNPNNKIYIGQSVDIHHRWKKYKWLNCTNQRKLLNSLKKYGFEYHKFEIVEECNIENLNERERYWQEYHNSINGGLNCRYTETNDKSGKLSNETKHKIGNSNKGKISNRKGVFGVYKHSDETKQKISNSQKGKRSAENNPMYGKFHSDETKQKIKEKRKTQIITNETRKKLSEAGKLRIWSDTVKEKISKANKGKSKPDEMKIKFGRPVLQYDFNGNFIKEYYSSQKAADEMGVSKLAIYNCASGRSKTSAGFTWKFK
jgi:group I intron endonuclease